MARSWQDFLHSKQAIHRARTEASGCIIHVVIIMHSFYAVLLFVFPLEVECWNCSDPHNVFCN